MPLQRRTLLKAFTAGTALGSVSQLARASLPTTRRDSEGPYYPVEPIPLDANLRLDAQHAGDPLRFSGRVVNTDAVAIADCRVEIWQCDGNSIYRHPRAPDTGRMDSAFRGFGAAITDADGRFVFETIVPVAYPGRPPHIHARLWVDGDSRLTTQVYVEGEAGADGRMINPIKGAAGYAASFEFVLG